MSRSLLTFPRRLPGFASITSNSARMASTLTGNTISNITNKEKEITGSERPVKGGPTAQAQSHVGERLTGNVVSDIVQGEKNITGNDGPAQGGPASVVQSAATSASSDQAASNQRAHTGKLDAATISDITAKETEITGSVEPVKGGPTAQAQRHAGEPINSANLHDITEGEKKITGGDRVKGGPTATAQSELGTARNG